MSIWPASGSNRVFRGGCWIIDPQYARVAIRYDNDPPGIRGNYRGVRLMRRCT